MNQPVSVSQPADLDNFIDFLFDGLQGYCYLVAKTPGSKDPMDWTQEFFEYPAQAEFMANTIRMASAKFEVYLAPAIYKTPNNATKENVKASNVVWTEFDGNTPDLKDLPGEPSCVIQSSKEGHDHIYWRLSEPLMDVAVLEDYNRRITYGYGADSSAWDATQVLRPPGTLNHKRSLPVTLKSLETNLHEHSIFSSLGPAPEQIETTSWNIATLPDTQDVLLRHAFSEDLVQLLKKPVEKIPDRSAALMQLAYGCAQMNLSDVEIFVMIRALDDKLEKFKGRRDRDKRLAHIITVARHKYPQEDHSADPFALIMNYGDLMATELEFDWVIEDMLMDGGNMLMAGQGGIGKSQMTLQFMKHIALGKDYLGYKIPSPKKIGFLSLEMGLIELQTFLRTQEEGLTVEEKHLLSQNLDIIPMGESWGLNLPEGQAQLEKILGQFEWDGLFVDSVGSAVIGNISSSEVVQGLTNFNDRIRNKYGIFLWYIHHTRKAQPGQQGAQSQDDVYGDQYLVNRATSVYGLAPGKGGTIKVQNWKNRLAKKEDSYYVERTPDLNFVRTNVQVDTNIEQNLLGKSSDDDEPKSNGGHFNL